MEKIKFTALKVKTVTMVKGRPFCINTKTNGLAIGIGLCEPLIAVVTPEEERVVSIENLLDDVRKARRIISALQQ